MLYICIGMFSDIHNAYPIRYCEMAERVRRTNAEIDHAVMTELENWSPGRASATYLSRN